MKKKFILGLLLSAILGLAGCGSRVIETDTLSLSKDGTASYTIVSDFSKPYYDLEELKTMAAREIAQYGSGVQISEAIVEEGTLHFSYTFDTLSGYAGFMETSCYQGTVAQALREGYKSDTVLNAVKGSKVTMKDLDNDKHHLFIWNESIAVRCTGNVLYFSDNLSTSGKKDVVPKGDSTGPYYVIYK